MEKSTKSATPTDQRQPRAQRHSGAINQPTKRPCTTPKLRGWCRIDEQLAQYEFDSGASTTCINTATFQALQINRPIQPYHGKVIAANGPLTTLGTATLKITLGNHTFDLTVLVVDLGEGHTILLGRDVYEHYPNFSQAINQIKTIIEDSDRHILGHPPTTQKQTASTTKHETASDILVIIRPISNPNEHKPGDTSPQHHTKSTTDSTTDEEQHAAEQIKDLLSSIAASSFSDLTPTDTVTHQIKLIAPSQPPFKQKMRKVPFARREAFRKLLQEQVDAKLLVPSRSPYSSPVLLVGKPDGTIRLTIDYKWMNQATVKDAYHLPNIENLFVALSRSKYYTKVDCFSGFYQVQMDADSTQYTAFSCEWGIYEYVVMPMGLTNAPATFQRLMNRVLQAEIEAGIVVVYMDDLLIHSATLEQHLQHVTMIVERLRQHGIKIKLSKCEIAQQTVTFLGHEVTHGEIRPNAAKSRILFEYPRPLNITQLQAFLGLAGYYRKFIAGFAKIASPLYSLLSTTDTSRSKKTPLNWTDDTQTAFDQLRTILTTHPFLILPNFDLNYILDTDACGYAVGAVLSQEQDNQVRPVGYFSKHLSPAQQNYSTTERELLAIVLAVENFAQYLYGKHFTVNSDHQPLQWLFKTAKLSARLARWIIRLNDFSFTIHYKQGKSNANADALSRWPLDSEDTHNEQEEQDERIIATIHTTLSTTTSNGQQSTNTYTQLFDTSKQLQEQLKDEDIQWIINIIKQYPTAKPKNINHNNNHQKQLLNNYDNLQEIDDVLNHIKIDKSGQQITRYVLPRHLTNWAINTAHHTSIGGHLGINKTLAKLDKRFFSFGLRERVEQQLKECDTCQKVKYRPIQRAPLIPILPTRPGQLLTTDLTGAMTLTKRGNKYAMVIVDHFTKFVNTYALTNMETTTLADKLIHHMMRFGIVEQLLSDLGTQLQSQVLELVYDTFGIQRLRTTAYHPECDGISERVIQTVKMMLSTLVNDKCVNWDEHLDAVTYAYNTSKHATTGFTPFELQFGRLPILPIDLVLHSETRHPPSPRPSRQYDTTNIDDDDTEIITLRDSFDLYNEKVPEIAKQYHEQLISTLRQAFEIASKQRDYKMDKAKLHHDRKAQPDAFEKDDLVLALHPAIISGQTRGLAKKAHGPFRIIERVGPVDYLIQLAANTNSKRLLLHQHSLRKYFGQVPAESPHSDIHIKLERHKRPYNRRNINTQLVTIHEDMDSTTQGGGPAVATTKPQTPTTKPKHRRVQTIRKPLKNNDKRKRGRPPKTRQSKTTSQITTETTTTTNDPIRRSSRIAGRQQTKQP